MGADAVFVESRSKRSMGHVMSTLVDCGISVKTRIPHEVPPAGSHVTVEFASTDEPQIYRPTPLDAKMTNNIRWREVPRGLGDEAKDRPIFQRCGMLGGPVDICQLIDPG
jgi:hypothetical protein